MSSERLFGENAIVVNGEVGKRAEYFFVKFEVYSLFSVEV